MPVARVSIPILLARVAALAFALVVGACLVLDAQGRASPEGRAAVERSGEKAEEGGYLPTSKSLTIEMERPVSGSTADAEGPVSAETPDDPVLMFTSKSVVLPAEGARKRSLPSPAGDGAAEDADSSEDDVPDYLPSSKVRALPRNRDNRN
jgi:hypothetical protein